jgi:hypothetical protein
MGKIGLHEIGQAWLPPSPKIHTFYSVCLHIAFVADFASSRGGYVTARVYPFVFKMFGVGHNPPPPRIEGGNRCLF